MDVVILPDGYRRRTAIFVVLTAFALSLLLWQVGVAGSNATAVFSFIGLVSLCALLSFETRISQEQRRVVRTWNLAGVVPIWRRTYPFVDLCGVQQRFYAEAQDDIWQVGLVTAAGKFLMVTYFTSRTQSDPESEAARFRDYLAHMLDVPVLDKA